MSDEDVMVDVEGQTRDNAVALLEAAERLGLEDTVVRTTSDGFSAPKAVVDEAFGPVVIDQGPKDYTAMKVDELKDEIDERNKNRDVDAQISKEGNKSDLVAALVADDEVDKGGN